MGLMNKTAQKNRYVGPKNTILIVEHSLFKQFWKYETDSGKATGLSGNIFFPQEGSEGNQTVLRVAGLKDSLITRGTSCGKRFPNKT